MSMKIKRILLTGDDGYNSIGTRILIYYLKDKYELAIAGTRKQQSGVGGHLSLQSGGTWGETTVDGVPAFWTDGYPCDSIECAVGYFVKPFDLVISGINLGSNIGGAVVSSGTVSAALRAVNLQLAEKAMVMSWRTPPSYWYHAHNGEEDIKEYLRYPGRVAYQTFQIACKHELWGADVLNINFPKVYAKAIRFTQGIPDIRKYFTYPIPLDVEKHTFTYPEGSLRDDTKGNLTIDTGAILSEYVSITPFQKTMLDHEVYQKMQKTVIPL